jgi:hypothetical protein
MLKTQPKEEALKFGASSALLTMDVHQYVTLAHGPDMEEAIREEEENNSNSCWIKRSFVSKGHEESSIATKLPYSSSHTTTLFLNPTKINMANKTH